MAGGYVARLLRALRGGSDPAADRVRTHLESTRDRLDVVRQQRDDLQHRLDEAREQVARFRRKRRAAELLAARWKTEKDYYRRRVLSTAVLKDLLPARREQLHARASADGAEEREARLITASTAYREAVRSADPGPLAARTELDGLAWWVPVGSDDADLVRRIVAKESLPYRALAHAREVCTGGIMLDLGAHDGSTAIPRVLLGEVEACYCAEPDPLNYACLVANIVENGLRGFVLPDRVAIGARDGSAKLLRTKFSRGHRVLHDEDAGESEITEIKVRTLDTWLDELGVDPRAISFVKSDTQGYEMQVLLGASRLVSRAHVAWQLEFAPKLMRLAGSDPREFLSLLQQRFTHFIDLNPAARGRRLRPVRDLTSVLDYVESQRLPHTDLIVYAGPRKS